MNHSRRDVLTVTTAGLISVASNPVSLLAVEPTSTELTIRKAKDRGHTDLGWLKSYHSFSFGRYHDAAHMGFRALRVINDDRVSAGRGFPTHPHRNMEIISYVLDGSLKHRDSTGKGAIITPDDIQVMSAGRGITHSEFNPSRKSDSHFLQIWIDPALRNTGPRYTGTKVSSDEKQNQWKRIVGPSGSKASVKIRHDASIYASIIERGRELDYVVERRRHAWLQVARGQVEINGSLLREGDAIASSRPTDIHVKAKTNAEVLLFDLG